MSQQNGNGRTPPSRGRSALGEHGVTLATANSLAMDLDEIHPPGKVLELAASCVRFVLAALKVELDFTPDTLSILDHYIEQGRSDVAGKPALLALSAHAIGAYLGEVVRRHHACWWRLEPKDAGAWRLEFRNVYLCFYPVQVAYTAFTRTESDEAFSGFEMPADDMSGLLERLAELPAVRAAEYFAPSTRLEVLDIAVDALLAQRAADPTGARPYAPEDYQEPA